MGGEGGKKYNSKGFSREYILCNLEKCKKNRVNLRYVLYNFIVFLFLTPGEISLGRDLSYGIEG